MDARLKYGCLAIKTKRGPKLDHRSRAWGHEEMSGTFRLGAVIAFLMICGGVTHDKRAENDRCNERATSHQISLHIM